MEAPPLPRPKALLTPLGSSFHAGDMRPARTNHEARLLFTDDFEALCNVLRPPAYGPPRPGGFGLPYEYGPDLGPPYQGLPYGPELYSPPVLPYDPYPPPPGPFARREAPYGAPPFDMPDFEDDGGPYSESEAAAPPGPGSRWRYRSRDTRGSFPEPEESPEGGGYPGEHRG